MEDYEGRKETLQSGRAVASVRAWSRVRELGTVAQ